MLAVCLKFSSGCGLPATASGRGRAPVVSPRPGGLHEVRRRLSLVSWVSGHVGVGSGESGDTSYVDAKRVMTDKGPED